jgi:hypothetical protein
MSLQIIYSGSQGNDGTGTLLRIACQEINSNINFLSQSVLDYSFPYTGSGLIKEDLQITGSITGSGYQVNKLRANRLFASSILSASQDITMPNDERLAVNKLASAVDPTTYIQFTPQGEDPMGTYYFYAENTLYLKTQLGSVLVNPERQPFLFHVGGFENLEGRGFIINCGPTDEEQYISITSDSTIVSPEGYALHVDGTGITSFQRVASLGKSIIVDEVPTSDPSVTGQLYTQTATQIGGTGNYVVLCIS